MKTLLKFSTLFLLLLISIKANALDLDYYTYGGFDVVVKSFERMALIFSDNAYITIIGVMAILGMVMAGLVNFLKPALGGKASGLAWAVPTIMGTIFFMATIIPTGTLHVYDPGKNEYRAVPNVPDAIVLVAGLFNKIERIMVEITNTSALYPYSANPNGNNFKIIFEALSPGNKSSNYYLRDNISSYYYACAGVAMGTNKVKSADIWQNTDSLYKEFEKMKNAAIFADMYDDTHPSGTSQSCTDAWDNYLKPALDDPNNFTNMRNNTCAKSSFNTNSPAQLAACNEKLEQAYKEHGITPKTAIQYLRNKQIAYSTLAALDQTDPDAAQLRLMNRNLIINGIGVMNAANDTIPIIRAVTTAIVIGLVPFLAIFLVTPLMSKAIIFMLGAFAWLATWGIMVAVAHSGAMDEALQAFNAIRDSKMGLDAILGGEEAAIKAMAIFGRMQTMSLLLATAIAMALFKFGGYAISSMAQAHAENLQQLGEQSSQQTMTPEGRSQTRDAMQQAMANQAAHSAYGGASGGNAASIAAKTSQALTNYSHGKKLLDTDQLSEISKNAGINNAGRLVGQSNAMNTYTKDTGGTNIEHVAGAANIDVLNKLNAKTSQEKEAFNIGEGDINKGIGIRTDNAAGRDYGSAVATLTAASQSDQNVREVARNTANSKQRENISQLTAIDNIREKQGNGNLIDGANRHHNTEQIMNRGDNFVKEQLIKQAGSGIRAAVINNSDNLVKAEATEGNYRQALDVSTVNYGQQLGQLNSVNAFNKMMGEDATPSNIRDTAINMGVAKGISVPFNSRDEIINSPIGDAMSKEQKDMLPENGILNVVANPGNSDVPLSFSLSNQGNVNYDHSASEDKGINTNISMRTENGYYIGYGVAQGVLLDNKQDPVFEHAHKVSADESHPNHEVGRIATRNAVAGVLAESGVSASTSIGETNNQQTRESAQINSKNSAIGWLASKFFGGSVSVAAEAVQSKSNEENIRGNSHKALADILVEKSNGNTQQLANWTQELYQEFGNKNKKMFNDSNISDAKTLQNKPSPEEFLKNEEQLKQDFLTSKGKS